jgi:hypothetical protein
MLFRLPTTQEIERWLAWLHARQAAPEQETKKAEPFTLPSAKCYTAPRGQAALS